MSRIFLSHSSKDDREAVALKQWLVEQDPPLATDIFLDLDRRSGIRPGTRWKDALREANSRCEAVICLLSSSWETSSECKTEYRTAETLNKRIFCARLEPLTHSDISSEWQRVDLFGDGPKTAIEIVMNDEHEVVEFATEGLLRLKDEIVNVGVGPESFAWPPPSDPGRTPYRGWEPHDEVDAGVFFGRDAQLVRGLDALRRMRASGVETLFVVLGASGSGKSSFMRAGLLPRLRRDNREFVVLDIVRPERNVLTGPTGLANAIHSTCRRLGLTEPHLADIKAACRTNSRRLRELLREIQEAAARSVLMEEAESGSLPTLVLPVDQAEELFACDAGDEALQFLRMLDEHARTPNAHRLPLIVAVTIRTDHAQSLQSVPELASVKAVLFDDLKPMPPGQFKEVIVGPARRATDGGRPLQIEPALVDGLLADCTDGADTLPLLSLMLARLFDDYGDDGDLTLAEYQAMGGMRNIVQTEVDGLLSRDSGKRSKQLELLRTAFVPWLATFNPGNDQAVRRIARWDDLPPETHPLLESFVAKRLLVKDTRASGDVVEVALESLLRQWDELTGWLREQRQNLLNADDIQRDDARWEAAGRNPDYLLSGTRLSEAVKLAQTREFVNILATSADFLAASREAANRRIAAEEERRQAELRAARDRQQEAEKYAAELRWRSRKLKAVLVVTAIVAIIAVVAAMFARIQWNHAKTQSDIATAASRETKGQQLIADAEGMLAGTRPGGDTRGFQELLAAPQLMRSPYDNSLFSAVLTKADTSQIINYPMRAGKVTAVRSVAVSLDGKWIASGGDDNTVHLWDAETGEQHTEFAVDDGGGTSMDRVPILIVLFSPDGKRIATGSGDQLQVWDAGSGKNIGGPMTLAGIAQDLAFSPDGRRIVTGSDNGAVQVWDLATRDAKLGRLDGEFSVRSVAFNRDGDLIASGGDDTSVRLWDARTLEQVAVVKNTNSVTSLAFSPAGEPRLVVGRIDGNVEILDGRNLAEEDSFEAHPNAVNTVRFSPDGSRIVSGGADNTVRVWDATTREPMLVGHPLRGHHGEVTSVVFNPTGTRVVSGSLDGSVREWDVIGGLPIPTAQDRILDVAFSRDGRKIASAGSDGTIRMWNPDTAKPIGRLGDPAGNPPAVNSLAFNPAGSQLVAGAQDGSVRVWNLNNGRGTELEVPRTRPHTVPPAKSRRITSVALSADGSLIVSGGADRAVRLWDARTLTPVGVMFAPFQVWSVAISPDGRTVASASGDKDSSIQLWNVATLIADGAPMVGQPGWSIHSIDFSPDGQRIVSGSHDGIIQVWNVKSREPLTSRPMSVDANPVLSVAFAHDHPWIVSGYADGAVRVWDATSYQLIGASFMEDRVWVPSVAISEDDRRILSGNVDGSLQLWPTPKDLTGRLCDKLSANISPREWREWVSPTDDYVAACHDLPVPPANE